MMKLTANQVLYDRWSRIVLLRQYDRLALTRTALSSHVPSKFELWIPCPRTPVLYRICSGIYSYQAAFVEHELNVPGLNFDPCVIVLFVLSTGRRSQPNSGFI